MIYEYVIIYIYVMIYINWGFVLTSFVRFFIAIGEEYDDKLLNVRNSSAQSRPQ